MTCQGSTRSLCAQAQLQVKLLSKTSERRHFNRTPLRCIRYGRHERESRLQYSKYQATCEHSSTAMDRKNAPSFQSNRSKMLYTLTKGAQRASLTAPRLSQSAPSRTPSPEARLFGADREDKYTASTGQNSRCRSICNIQPPRTPARAFIDPTCGLQDINSVLLGDFNSIGLCSLDE